MSQPQIASSRPNEQTSKEVIESNVNMMMLEIEKGLNQNKRVHFSIVRPAKEIPSANGFAQLAPGDTAVFIFQIGDAQVSLWEALRGMASASKSVAKGG